MVAIVPNMHPAMPAAMAIRTWFAGGGCRKSATHDTIVTNQTNHNGGQSLQSPRPAGACMHVIDTYRFI
jgi:hypothetical protein